MDLRAVVLHDEALQMAPPGAQHDECPLCSDFQVTADGVPVAFDRLDEAQRQEPFGSVEYADPGFLEDGVKRFPLNTEARVRAALTHLEQTETAGRYANEQLSQVRERAQKALQRYESPDTDLDEGGKVEAMDKTITEETHQALLAKAVQDATEQASQEVSRLNESVASLTEERDKLLAKVETTETENARLNSELDEAQVKLKSSEDEVASLRDELVERDEQAKKSEVATARADQVRNLNLFPDEYITEKAERWADASDEEWEERLEEWKQAKATHSGENGGAPDADVASAMTGTSTGGGSKDTTPARKRVLGLA